MVYTHELIESSDTKKKIEYILGRLDLPKGISFENPFPLNPNRLCSMMKPIRVSRFDYLAKEKDWLEEGFSFAKLPEMNQGYRTIIRKSYDKIKNASNAYTKKMEELFVYIRAAYALTRISKLEQFDLGPILTYEPKLFKSHNIERTIGELIEKKVLLPELNFIPHYSGSKNIAREKYLESLKNQKNEVVTEYKTFLNETMRFKNPYTLQAAIEVQHKISDFHIETEQRKIEESTRAAGMALLEKEKKLYESLSEQPLEKLVDSMKNSGYVRYERYDVEDFRRHAFNVFLALKINDFRISTTRGIASNGIPANQLSRLY